jgi:hypothetical protein
MKTKLLFIGILFVSMATQSQGLSKLTLGVGAGGNHLFKDIYDYSLTTDGSHNLKINTLGRNDIVVSPVVIFRLVKLKQTDDKTLVANDDNSNFKFLKNFSLLLSTDLINMQTDKVAFNKSIDGGIGLGYSFSTNLMIGVFYEIKTYRQLRDYVVEQYENKPIPNGTEVFNALDQNNNNLFYNKKMDGFSVKLIFNINSL